VLSDQFSYRNLDFWANEFWRTGRINLEKTEIIDDIAGKVLSYDTGKTVLHNRPCCDMLTIPPILHEMTLLSKISIIFFWLHAGFDSTNFFQIECIIF